MKSLRCCILAFVAFPLSGCGGASSGSAPGAIPAPIPQAAFRVPLSRTLLAPMPAAKISGTWGVSVGDSVAANYASSSPMTCSTPAGSTCNGIVKKHTYPDSLSVSGTDPTSGANDSGAITADAELGHLTGTVTATAAAGFIPPNETVSASGQGTVNVQWIDTFLITSATLPAGTPVTFASSMKVTDKTALTCLDQDAEVYAGVVGAGGTSGALAYLRECTSGKFKLQYTPILTGMLSTTVGSTVSIYGWLELYLTAEAGAPPFSLSLTNKIESAAARFTLVPVTPGASYETASGKTY